MLKILSFTNVISQIKVTRNKLNKFDYLLHVNALLTTTHRMMCCCIYCTKICKTKLTPKKKKNGIPAHSFVKSQALNSRALYFPVKKVFFMTRLSVKIGNLMGCTD